MAQKSETADEYASRIKEQDERRQQERRSTERFDVTLFLTGFALVIIGKHFLSYEAAIILFGIVAALALRLSR